MHQEVNMSDLLAALRADYCRAGCNPTSCLCALCESAADEIERLRAAMRELLAVVPVLPAAAKHVIGMEERYNAALAAARRVLADPPA